MIFHPCTVEFFFKVASLPSPRRYLASNCRWTTPLGSENSSPKAFSRQSTFSLEAVAVTAVAAGTLEVVVATAEAAATVVVG
jgi:hypothetical protein